MKSIRTASCPPQETLADKNQAFEIRFVSLTSISMVSPGTPMTRDFVEKGLITNSRVDEYDGTTAVTRSAHLSAEEIEFMRWRAERWMKVRHMSAAVRHDPAFVLRHARRMLAHTFRGTSWRSALGVENAREVFRRYRAIRAREREYIDWPDPMAATGNLVNATDTMRHTG